MIPPAAPLIDASQNTPVLWFLISLLVWFLVALLVWKIFRRMQFKSQGLTTVRTRFYRKVQHERVPRFHNGCCHSPRRALGIATLQISNSWCWSCCFLRSADSSVCFAVTYRIIALPCTRLRMFGVTSSVQISASTSLQYGANSTEISSCCTLQLHGDIVCVAPSPFDGVGKSVVTLWRRCSKTSCKRGWLPRLSRSKSGTSTSATTWYVRRQRPFSQRSHIAVGASMVKKAQVPGNSIERSGPHAERSRTLLSKQAPFYSIQQ